MIKPPKQLTKELIKDIYSEYENSSSDESLSVDQTAMYNYLKSNPRFTPDGSIFVRFSNVTPMLHRIIEGELDMYFPIVFEANRVKILLSEEEKIRNKKEYQTLYNSRPEVKLKREMDRHDPIRAAERKLHSQLETTKERKKLRSLAQRQIIKQMKSNPNSEYSRLLESMLPPQSKKRAREDESDENGSKRKKTEVTK